MTDLKHANDTLFRWYSKLIQQEEVDMSDGSKTSLRNLAWMRRTAVDSPLTFDKASRWLGFVQGCLAMRGIIDVNEERDCSRGLFTAAVGAQPTLEDK